jgi:hypothetical protein
LIDVLALQSARGAVRQILRLPEDEIVDLVFLASIVCNFDPNRLLPMWLIIVGSPSSGKTEITKLIRKWKHTWPLPARISGGYFFSSRNRKESGLNAIEASGARIMSMDDLAGLVSMDIQDAGHLYSQLIGIHDGHLIHRTGFTPDELVYGPKEPNERLGFIASATEKFYGFQERWFQFGSRFMVYYLADVKREWDDYSHLSHIADMADIARKSKHAEVVVQQFLNHAIEHISEFEAVQLEHEDLDRLSAAVTLVQRVLGAGRVSDPGVRLHRRVVHMVRMFAFLQARDRVDESDMAKAIRLILSQLPVQEHRIIRYSLEHLAQPWTFGDLLEAAGGSRKFYASPLECLADVRILRRASRKNANGYQFELHPRAIALVDVFDPNKSIFPR